VNVAIRWVRAAGQHVLYVLVGYSAWVIGLLPISIPLNRWMLGTAWQYPAHPVHPQIAKWWFISNLVVTPFALWLFHKDGKWLCQNWRLVVFRAGLLFGYVRARLNL
jgi:hypothetical protein